MRSWESKYRKIRGKMKGCEPTCLLQFFSFPSRGNRVVGVLILLGAVEIEGVLGLSIAVVWVFRLLKL